MTSFEDFKSRVDTYFSITAKGTDFWTETRAGLITFLTMSYILVVNPTMMAEGGMDWNAVLTGTALSAAIASLLMGLYARYPIAQAPGMGINAFFVYTVIIGMGYTWEQALGFVFVSGVAFFIVSVSGIRNRVMDSIPKGVRLCITAGIGAFIAFVGLQSSGIISADPSTLVALGDLTDPMVLLALTGVILTFILVARNIRGAALFGIVGTAIIGMVFGLVSIPSSVVAVPAMPYIGEFWNGLMTIPWDISAVVVVISFLFVDFFDTTGTILSVGSSMGAIGDDGKMDTNGGKALVSDAVGTVTGAVIGVSTVTSYVESMTGIESGGRTGFVAVVVAALFLVSLMFAPIFSVISYPCTVGALLLVGAMMISQLKELEWSDMTLAVTATVALLSTMLMYSITSGIAMSFIVYSVMMVASGRTREMHLAIPVMALLFAGYFAMLAMT